MRYKVKYDFDFDFSADNWHPFASSDQRYSYLQDSPQKQKTFTYDNHWVKKETWFEWVGKWREEQLKTVERLRILSDEEKKLREILWFASQTLKQPRIEQMKSGDLLTLSVFQLSYYPVMNGERTTDTQVTKIRLTKRLLQIISRVDEIDAALSSENNQVLFELLLNVIETRQALHGHQQELYLKKENSDAYYDDQPYVYTSLLGFQYMLRVIEDHLFEHFLSLPTHELASFKLGSELHQQLTDYLVYRLRHVDSLSELGKLRKKIESHPWLVSTKNFFNLFSHGLTDKKKILAQEMSLAKKSFGEVKDSTELHLIGSRVSHPSQ